MLSEFPLTQRKNKNKAQHLTRPYAENDTKCNTKPLSFSGEQSQNFEPRTLPQNIGGYQSNAKKEKKNKQEKEINK